MLKFIIDSALQQNKNILIVSSPRSGTHPLGAEIAAISGAKNMQEICMVGYCNNPWDDIEKMANTKRLTVGQLVQLTPKIVLAENIDKIKKHNVIVNIKRRDKLNQFASWMYFRVLDPTGLYGWHNHTNDKIKIQPGQLTAQIQDITQFKLEQIVDDYFLPDFKLCYEELTFENQKNFKRNQFPFPLPQIFSNLNYVEEQLNSWHYTSEHLK
jgi:hypothetical protein